MKAVAPKNQSITAPPQGERGPGRVDALTVLSDMVSGVCAQEPGLTTKVIGRQTPGPKALATPYFFQTPGSLRFQGLDMQRGAHPLGP